MYCGDLQANTATTISFGPALDKDDADTEKTDTIADTEFFLSKNGGNLANPNDTDDATHDQDGMFNKALNGTDLNEEGLLTIICHKADHLYMRQDYTVLAQAAYISKYTEKDSGFMDVDVKAMSTSTAAADAVEAVFTGAGAAADVDLDARSLTLNNDADSAFIIASSDDSAVKVTSSGGNGHGIEVAGNGSGEGISATGGLTGEGIEAIGGGTSGAGIRAAAQNNNDAGMELVKNGTGADLDADNLAYLAGLDTGVAADADLTTFAPDGSLVSHMMTVGADTSTYNASTDSLEAVAVKQDTAQTDLDTITGTSGVLIGTDAMDRSGTLDVNTKTITANAITANAINADAITSSELATSAADKIWDSVGADTSLSFEALLERCYQFFTNELSIVDDDGDATLRNFADDGDMATWTITDDDTDTDRTQVSWA